MSTLKVNKIEHTSTTDGGVSIDSSGNVTLPANTKVGTQNLPSAGPLSNRNLVINGAMQVAQRGTSSTGTGYQTVDRIRAYHNTGTVTQSHESLTSGDPYDEGFRHFYRVTQTTSGSNATGKACQIDIYPEAQDLAKSGWNYTSSNSYVTLSFWVRCSLAGTYYVYNRTYDGTSQSYTFSYTVSANTWTKVTHSIPGFSNITIDNNTDRGWDFRFYQDLGTNNTDSGHTLNTWAETDDTSRTPDFGQDFTGTTGATFDITGVQLELGEVATPFEHRSYGDELQRCWRYCQRYPSVQASGTVQISTDTWHPFTFSARFRANPTLTVNSLGQVVKEGTAWYSNTQITTDSPTPLNVTLHCNQSNNNMSALNPCRLGQGCDLTFSAEL